MDKKPERKILRIVLPETVYEAVKAASTEDVSTMSAFGRRAIVRALRARKRDKTLQAPETEPDAVRGK